MTHREILGWKLSLVTGFVLLVGNATGLLAQESSTSTVEASPPTSGEAATTFEIPETERPFWDNAQLFVDAYAARNAEQIGQLFTEDAEFLDENGMKTSGRENIVAHYQNAFENYPEALIEQIHLVAVRQLSDTLAVEEGSVIASESPSSPRFQMTYHAIHKKEADGVWRILVLRDSPRQELGRAEQLAQLEWMIGEWINEDDDSTVTTTCKWSEDGNFLLREFHVVTHDGNEMTGVQRIGWDPVHKKLRSWTFDSEGGFFSGLWTRTEGGWVLTSAGVTATGETVTAAAVYEVVDSEMILWQYQNLIIGDKVVGDSEPITMVRIPPTPTDDVSKTE